MQLTTLLTAAMASTVSAQLGYAVVQNNCTFPAYVQSYPYGGGAPGPLTTLAPGQSFKEKFRTTGSTVKLARTKTLTNPLFFGYSITTNPNYAYYEFSTQYGNPFSTFPDTLSAGAGCQAFDCAANSPNCYSTPSSKKVYGCPRPVNLTATLCS